LQIDEAAHGPEEREWTDLVRDHSRLFYLLAYRILQDRDGAEDACQQALLKAWERRATLREAARFRAWVARVVVTESLQAVRRARIERRAMASQRTATPPLVLADQVVLRETLLEAIGTLREPLRQAVILRLVDGLSGNQTAELMECSAVEVSRRLHHGLAQLRQLLKGEENGE
jgi:RNA polymerase sigma-70 factor (ECF subfamily)